MLTARRWLFPPWSRVLRGSGWRSSPSWLPSSPVSCTTANAAPPATSAPRPIGDIARRGMCTLRMRSRSGFRLRGSPPARTASRAASAGPRAVAGATSVARSPCAQRALGRAAGPVAQPPHVARLREIQQGKNGQAQEGGQPQYEPTRSTRSTDYLATMVLAAFTSVPASSSASRPELPYASRTSPATSVRGTARRAAPPVALRVRTPNPPSPDRGGAAPPSGYGLPRWGPPARRVEELLAQLLARPGADDLDRHLARAAGPRAGSCCARGR